MSPAEALQAQPAPAVSAETVRRSVQRLIEYCEIVQSWRPTRAVEIEMHELEAIDEAIQSEWPLPAEIKSKIYIGAFAAKNISDWEPLLADLLMSLDYSLRHDGADLSIAQPKKHPATTDGGQSSIEFSTRSA